MKYATEAAFRVALEARLLNLVGPNNNKQLVRFRKMVAYERLLARLTVVAPDQWFVKGGLALEFRYGDRSRTTVDLDLGVPISSSTLTELLVDAGRLDLADYFRYVVDRTQSLAFQDDVDVARYRITVLLDGRRFEQIAIDVGFGHFPTTYDSIETSNLLEFAGFAPVLVPTIPLAVHVAEKLHAYTRQYGEGRQSTRVKDLIDIVLIASLSGFELDPLRREIVATFASRGIQPVPRRLPRGCRLSRPSIGWERVDRQAVGTGSVCMDASVGSRSVSISLWQQNRVGEDQSAVQGSLVGR